MVKVGLDGLMACGAQSAVSITMALGPFTVRWESFEDSERS